MSQHGTCLNCGADYGLHHFETLQCPRHGMEAPFNKKQEWQDTRWESSEGMDILRGQIDQLQSDLAKAKAYIGRLETEITRLETLTSHE